MVYYKNNMGNSNNNSMVLNNDMFKSALITNK